MQTKNLISEDELVEWAKEAQKDYKNKKTKVLKSLTDLISSTSGNS